VGLWRGARSALAFMLGFTFTSALAVRSVIWSLQMKMSLVTSNRSVQSVRALAASTQWR